MKYKEWLDVWFANYIEPSSKTKTCERYSEIIEKHLKVKLGEYELEELSPIVIQKYITELMQSGNLTTGKGLAANSVNGIVTVIQNSLKLAYTLGELKEYTADKIRRPKTKEKEVSCFSLAEQKKIEQAALSNKKRKFIGIVICLYSGLRIGELLALTWSDIDFTKGTLIIQGILTNEKYCGDLLMQKTFTENCITKKVKKNRGEMPKYLIRDNHPAIITHATFKMAQMEMARRGSVRKKTDSGITEQGKYSGKFALTDILVCGECGSPYRRKTYSRNGENKRVWRCLSRLEHGTEFCSDSITVDDETLKKTIVRGISKAISDKQDVLNLILSNLAYAVTGEDDTLEMYAIEKQLKTLSGIMDETMELAASSTGDGKRFQEEMKSLSSQMVVLREQLEIIKGRIDSNKKVNEEIENIKQCLSADSLDFSEYNDVAIRRLVEYIRVMKDNSIIIVLKGGMQIHENI